MTRPKSGDEQIGHRSLNARRLRRLAPRPAAGGAASRRPSVTRAARRVERVRARRRGRPATPRQQARADERVPGRRERAGPRLERRRDGRQLVDGVERVELREPKRGVVPQPVVVGRLAAATARAAANCARSPPWASVTAASDRSHHGRARDLGGLLEPRRGRAVVAEPPVVDEPDVLQVVPAGRVGPEPLLEKRDRLVRAARARPGTPRRGRSSRTGRRS